MTIDTIGIDKTEYNVCCRGNILICTVGLPRCGKSTWAKKIGYPIVDPDAIRLALTGRRWYGPIEHETWATVRTMIRALFFAGNKVVILDSANSVRSRRDLLVPTPDCIWKRKFVIFDTPVDVCKARAKVTYPELVDVIDWFAENSDPIDEKVEGEIIMKKIFNPVTEKTETVFYKFDLKY